MISAKSGTSVWTALLVALTLAFAATAAEARRVVMCTVPWAPFYDPGLEDDGFISEISRAAFRAAGHEAKLEFMPWARAMLEVRQGDRHVLMGAYYTDERAETYIASDRIYTTSVGLVALKDLDVNSYGELRDLSEYTIGYGRGWATTDEFDNADYLDKEAADNNVLNVRKLYAGRIDMIAMNFDRFSQIAADEGFDPDQAVFLDPPLQSSGLYLMASRAIENPETLIEEFNEGLEAIRENGRYDEIIERFGVEGS
ncbi:substrate-binding periplasmic protein [Halofilum ochraceum]|uniref:substrate-binding periplasmic protein n=1 Tax=Halofilum ochraceum TaxID=1611323 RepID=UPI001586732A|nr:transporter substrate-binding domain-containing protein [Halofilum ochraceum]